MAGEVQSEARASEASERVWRLLSTELDAAYLGEVQEDHEPEPLAIPGVTRGTTAKCVLCGNPTIWRSERNGAPVHEHCMADYVEDKRK